MSGPERWTIADAARYVRVAPVTFRAYVSRGQAPEPDGRESLSGKPWWWPETIRTWQRQRLGRGRRTDRFDPGVLAEHRRTG